jgi:hypothetical protein
MRSAARRGSREHWAAYRLQAVGDDPDMSGVTLVACSWPCLVERCQMIIELTQSVWELSGGVDDAGGGALRRLALLRVYEADHPGAVTWLYAIGRDGPAHIVDRRTGPAAAPCGIRARLGYRGRSGGDAAPGVWGHGPRRHGAVPLMRDSCLRATKGMIMNASTPLWFLFTKQLSAIRLRCELAEIPWPQGR